jgi:hypothetical protein
MRSKPVSRFLALTMAGALVLAIAPAANAQEEPVAVAAAASKSKAKPRKARTATNASAPVSLEARHKDCLAFMQRHGLTCDPWQQPTCGYDLGMYRPLTCVAP